MSTQHARRPSAESSSVRGIARMTRPLERERRRHPVLIGVTATLVVVLLVAWTRYDPIVNAELGRCPEGARLESAGRPAGDEDVCSFSNSRDVVVRLEATLANSGILPVTVSGVNLGGDVQDSLTITDLRLAGQGFTPTRLSPGEQVKLQVHGLLPACGQVDDGRVLVFRELPMRTRVLGLPRDSYVALIPPVQLIVSDC